MFLDSDCDSLDSSALLIQNRPLDLIHQLSAMRTGTNLAIHQTRFVPTLGRQYQQQLAYKC